METQRCSITVTLSAFSDHFCRYSVALSTSRLICSFAEATILPTCGFSLASYSVSPHFCTLVHAGSTLRRADSLATFLMLGVCSQKEHFKVDAEDTLQYVPGGRRAQGWSDCNLLMVLCARLVNALAIMTIDIYLQPEDPLGDLLGSIPKGQDGRPCRGKKGTMKIPYILLLYCLNCASPCST